MLTKETICCIVIVASLTFMPLNAVKHDKDVGVADDASHTAVTDRDQTGGGDLEKIVRVQSEDNTAVTVRRSAYTTGFHGNLTTVVKIPFSSSHLRTSECELLLIEDLPGGLFVDLDQLSDLSKWGGPEVLSSTDIDIEKPAFLSPRHKLHVFATVQNTEGWFVASVSMPFHLRYHRPAHHSQHASVSLPPPQVLAKCSDGSVLRGLGLDIISPCTSRNDSICSWVKLRYVTQNGFSLLKFTVPIGQDQHKQLVIGGTLSVTALGTALLVYAMTSRRKGHKQH